MPILDYFEDLLSLAFPEVCNACGKSLYKHENLICNVCKVKLPFTNFHLHQENPIEKTFWGRVNIHQSSAFLFFHKGNRVQHLMHQFKYKGKKEVGELLGNMYAYELLKCNYFLDASMIIPVPLHPDKQKKRGYNQSEWLAKGIANGLSLSYDNSILNRAVASSTQTKKSRFDRWKNVETIFKVENASQIEGKHIVLVDDVITTGATVEACANTLLSAANCKVSFLALAYAAK
jgi:ComF family protein